MTDLLDIDRGTPNPSRPHVDRSLLRFGRAPRKLSERLYDFISNPWRAMVLTASIVCLTVLVLAVLYRNHDRYVPDPGSYGILDTHTGNITYK